MVWLQLALVVGVIGVIAVAMRRGRVSPGAYADIDVGTVSESWLAEQRGGKSDRLSSTGTTINRGFAGISRPLRSTPPPSPACASQMRNRRDSGPGSLCH